MLGMRTLMSAWNQTEINMNESALFFSEKKKQQFMTRFSDVSNVSSKVPKIEDVRQLTTLLQYHSTYLNFRSHLLEDQLLHPATIFTLSKYPTRNFGMSISNQSRLLSEFFTVCCEYILFYNSIFTADMITSLNTKLDNEQNQGYPTRLVEIVNDLIQYVQTQTVIYWLF